MEKLEAELAGEELEDQDSGSERMWSAIRNVDQLLEEPDSDDEANLAAIRRLLAFPKEGAVAETDNDT